MLVHVREPIANRMRYEIGLVWVLERTDAPESAILAEGGRPGEDQREGLTRCEEEAESHAWGLRCRMGLGWRDKGVGGGE